MFRRLLLLGLIVAFPLTAGCGSSIQGNGGNGAAPKGGDAPAPKKPPKAATPNA